MMMITSYKVAESLDSLGTRNKIAEKPLAQDGALHSAFHGWPPREKGAKGQTLPPRWALCRPPCGSRDKGKGGRQVLLGSALPLEQKTGKAGAYKALLVLDGGAGIAWDLWPHSVSLPSSRGRLWLGVCMCEVSAAASSCCPLDSAGLGAQATVSVRGGRKLTSPALWNGGLVPDQLPTGHRCCEIHSETVLDWEMQPLMNQPPPVPKGKQRRASALHCPHLPCENKREMQEASARVTLTLRRCWHPLTSSVYFWLLILKRQ